MLSAGLVFGGHRLGSESASPGLARVWPLVQATNHLLVAERHRRTPQPSQALATVTPLDAGRHSHSPTSWFIAGDTHTPASTDAPAAALRALPGGARR